MDREKQIMLVLNNLNDNNTNFKEEQLELNITQFASLLVSMQEDNLINNVNILYADDMPYYINLKDIRITMKGIEHLKGLNKIVENDVLQILYDNRYSSSLSDGQIRKEVFIYLSHKEIEAYINLLKGKDFITIEKNKTPAYKHPTNKGLNTPSRTYETFRISQKGIYYVENGFKDNIKHDIVTEKIIEIADTTTQINQSLNSIARTFDMTLNAMGAQHQKSIQKQIESDKLLEQYIELLRSKEPGKENKIISFLTKLSGDLVIGLITEASKKLIS